MMHIIRRDPFAPATLGRALSSIFNDPFLAGALADSNADEGALAIDVSENDGEVLVRASLPGFSKKEVEIECHDGVLTIKAEQNEESEETGETYYRRERRHGSTSRRVALPSAVLEDDAKADLKDGVLTVRLPKSQKRASRKISVG